MDFIAMHQARMRERNRRLAAVKERQRWAAIGALTAISNRVCRAQDETNVLVNRVITVVENWPHR